MNVIYMIYYVLVFVVSLLFTGLITLFLLTYIISKRNNTKELRKKGEK
jgi:hypothetical protein